MKNGKIGVLVVDDHSIVREGLCVMLEARERIEVIGDAADGVEGVEQALALNPDVILMDLIMPRKDGISAITDIIARRPDARILVLTSSSDGAQIAESMHAGARGYILKDAKVDELVDAIYKVHAGLMPLHPLVARKLFGKFGPAPDAPRLKDVLTKRELAVAPLLGRGLSNREIGDHLKISDRTVGSHVSNMIRKMGVENRTQLALLAREQGLAPPHDDS